MQQDLDAELGRSMRELSRVQPDVRIERREQQHSMPGHYSYRYYQSIQVHGGAGYAASTTLAAAPAAQANFLSPLVIVAVVLAAAWAAVTAGFARRYELTTYSNASRVKLLLLWPLLAPFSASFRQQFVAALRGERIKITGDDNESVHAHHR